MRTPVYRTMLLFCLLMICAGHATASEEMRTKNTYAINADGSRPAATLADASWLVGSWTGTAFGQQFEQVWNAPSAGSMVGLFKLYGDDGVAFYEILLLTVEDDTLSLKVRHFNADFTAWEDREEFVNFRLVRLRGNELHFGGLSFYRRSDERIDGYIVMRNGDGLTEHHLIYSRSGSD